ncbi:MarR family winged helix-turn-helix transcriptional regulator [Cohnella faecalis]|uniref:MarR family transcriptional regulator n=1 Tax=Cohnella faecalis TaxID=2315694 RepID=A0A398CW04_9BACL|nr:MarR family transcriptional regulator [Cohnella faecalis]RIE04718.1 MarR family transcriptional regulator [Cohnella faecalis]
MEPAADFVKSWMKLTKDWNALLEAELAPQLTAGQLEVLELLLAHEPMKPSDLLPYLETTPAAITTLLDRMERAGLVVRNRNEGDRRIVWVTMTELGRSEVERGVKVRTDVANRSLDRLSSHNRQLLVYLISKVAGTRDAAAAAERQASAKPQSEDETEVGTNAS